MSAEMAQTADSTEDMTEYTYTELETFLEHFYDRDEEYGIGGPFTTETEKAAFVSTEDDCLYAQLQGAGFHVAFPENADDKTRFYVLELGEELPFSFTDRMEDVEVDSER